MNRKFLLDGLDGLKGLVLGLVPADIRESIGCVPMTTDGPWTDEEKGLFQTVIGIPATRTFWEPGGFINVPPSSDLTSRSAWLAAIAATSQTRLFLDPDTGFYSQHTGGSDKMILIDELKALLHDKKTLIVYRHQYWPNPRPTGIPENVYPYVWHSLKLLRAAGLEAFAYQSQAASLFFVTTQETDLQPLLDGMRQALAGVSVAVVKKRVVI